MIFGIGPGELIIILAIALVVIGPKRLPEMARALGRGYKEFQNTVREVKNDLEKDMYNKEDK